MGICGLPRTAQVLHQRFLTPVKAPDHDNTGFAQVNSDKSSTYGPIVARIIISNNPQAPRHAAASAPDGPQVRWLVVDEAGEGQRLDNYLMRILKGVPKTHVYRVIRSGEVRVNKGRAQADTRLLLGDEVRVPPVRVAEPTVDAAPAPAREFRSILKSANRPSSFFSLSSTFTSLPGRKLVRTG